MVARYLAVVTFSLGVIGGVQFIASTGALPPSWLSSPGALSSPTSEYDQERSAELADWKARRARYVAFADILEKRLLGGTIRLCEATERLFFFCVENYPEHLDFVSLAETGRNIKTRIASNLLRGFYYAQAERYGGSAMDEIVARLQHELGELPYEQQLAGRLE